MLNKSDPAAIQAIGEQIGDITQIHQEIRLVEAPFLGCGDGGLSPITAIPALARGFLSKHHPDSTLQLCSDSAVSVGMPTLALENLFAEIDQETSKSAKSGARSAQTIEYDVVLSFASEQRSLIEVLSAILKSYGVSVFYDNDERAELWGKKSV